MTAFEEHIKNAEEAIEKAEHHLKQAESLTRQVLIDNRIELGYHHIERAKVQIIVAKLYK
jgi:hypothetical protein